MKVLEIDPLTVETPQFSEILTSLNLAPFPKEERIEESFVGDMIDMEYSSIVGRRNDWLIDWLIIAT